MFPHPRLQAVTFIYILFLSQNLRPSYMNQLFGCPASPSSQSNDGQRALRSATPVRALTASSRWTALPSSSAVLQPSSSTAPSPLFAKDAENQRRAKCEAVEVVAGTANGVRNPISYTTEPNLEAYLDSFHDLSTPRGLRAENQACDCDIEIALMNSAGHCDARFTASQIY